MSDATKDKLEHAELIQSLNKKEKDIMNFINQNPGKSKEEIIKYFKKKYSRVPIYKAIDTLEKYGIIVVRKDPKNRQTNNIFINNESIIYRLIQDVDFIKNLYTELINQLESDVDTVDNPSYIIDMYDLFEFLISLYKLFTDIYFIKLFFDFPRQTSDMYILNKSYLSFFSEIYPLMFKLSSLHSKRYLKLTSIYKSYLSRGDPYQEIIDIIINNRVIDDFREHGYRIDDLLFKAEDLGLYGKIKILIDFISKLYEDVTKGGNILKWTWD